MGLEFITAARVGSNPDGQLEALFSGLAAIYGLHRNENWMLKMTDFESLCAAGIMDGGRIRICTALYVDHEVLIGDQDLTIEIA